jgi:hypothetical protein
MARFRIARLRWRWLEEPAHPNGLNDTVAIRNTVLARQVERRRTAPQSLSASRRTIRERDIAHWADPQQSRSSEINANHGDPRGLLNDPAGDHLELITPPYA